MEPVIRDEGLEAALTRAPEVRAPRNFRQRVMARMPETAVVQRNGWRLPVLAFAGGVGLGLVAVLALLSGVAGLMVTVAALGMECAAAVWWFWRVVRS
jgi:hypothetical protein